MLPETGSTRQLHKPPQAGRVPGSSAGCRDHGPAARGLSTSLARSTGAFRAHRNARPWALPCPLTQKETALDDGEIRSRSSRASSLIDQVSTRQDSTAKMAVGFVRSSELRWFSPPCPGLMSLVEIPACQRSPRDPITRTDCQNGSWVRLVGALFETEIICNKTVTLIGFAAILRPIALIVDCQNGSWVRSVTEESSDL
jgi:hypothetical protein